MVFDQQSFCVAPWFQVRNDQNASYRPCCQLQPELSKFNGDTDLRWPEITPVQWIDSDYVKFLRHEVSVGHRLPECGQCWRAEDAGAPSLRQTLNNTVTNGRGHQLDQTWMKSYFSRPSYQQEDLILSCDIKVNNLCNYSCLMCDPEDSTKILTKWRRDRHIPIIQERIEHRPGTLDRALELANQSKGYDLLEHSINLLPRHLKILGGEPLIDTRLLALLDNTPAEKKCKIKLIFVTNGSVDLHMIKERFRDWKDVLFVVSLEGINHVQDYVRQGSDWKQVKSNIQTYVTSGHTLSLHFCLQSLTLAHMGDLLKFADSMGTTVSTATVETPNYLGLACIPEKMKPEIAARLSEAKTALTPASCQLIDASITLLYQQTWDPTLTVKKSQYLDWYDPEQRWKTIFPEWIPYLR